MMTISTLVSDHLLHSTETIKGYARPIHVHAYTFLCPICGVERADAPPHGQTTSCACGSTFCVTGNHLVIEVPDRLARPQPAPDGPSEPPAADAYVGPFGTAREMEATIIALLLVLVVVWLALAWSTS